MNLRIFSPGPARSKRWRKAARHKAQLQESVGAVVAGIPGPAIAIPEPPPMQLSVVAVMLQGAAMRRR